MVAQGYADTASVFDIVLKLLLRHPQSTPWSGHVHGLRESELPVALFHLVTERWLSVFKYGLHCSMCIVADFFGQSSSIRRGTTSILYAVVIPGARNLRQERQHHEHV